MRSLMVVEVEIVGQSGLQLPFPGPHQVGMNLVLTGQLTDRFAAFKRFQGNPELIGSGVSPPCLGHNFVPPHA